ncbi:hypothetical protein [Sporosarcina obsidiansis]|uniref:hypothetical protein n=1 Tax=Sporosarcina obsidiansis TaxID=2660748 RepID=UPI00129A1426|nr:hypothetical protein [Sporosarcina obsidiansis]
MIAIDAKGNWFYYSETNRFRYDIIFTPVSSVNISVQGIKESKVHMECILIQAIPLGNEDPTADLFIGGFTLFHIDESIYENGRIDGLHAISRLAGANYATIGDVITMERPK